MKRVLTLLSLTVLSLNIFAQLQPPVLLTPVDSATEVNTTAEFDWRPSLGGPVTTYELEIDVSPNFTNPWSATVLGSFGKGFEMLFGTRYYWRVRAVSMSATSDWSDTLTFVTHLNDFEFVSPIDSSVIPAVRTELRWLHKEDLKYRVQYDTTSTFNSPAFEQRVINSPDIFTISQKGEAVRFTISDLYFNTTHYWRIQGFHSNDTSNWTPFSQFDTPQGLTSNEIPDNATDIDIDTMVDAFPMLGVANYEIQLDTNQIIDPLSTEYYHLIQNSPQFDLDQLLFGKDYYWQIRGINPNSTSEWTALRKFTTVGEIATVSPVADEVVTQKPTLVWNKRKGISNYDIQIADDALFTTGLIENEFAGEVGEYTFTTEIGFGTKYWRVRAISTRDTSAWSASVRFFTTPVGIEDVSNPLGVNLYPNPTSNAVFVNFETANDSKVNITVSDITGRIVYGTAFNANGKVNNFKINTDQYENGLYLIEINDNNHSYRSKFVVEH